MNIIKDVLGERFLKNNRNNPSPTERELHESIVKSLSDNKILSLDNDGIKFKRKVGKQLFINNTINEKTQISRGYVDFIALSCRYCQFDLLEKYLPSREEEVLIFKVINTARSLSIGVEQFEGCKVNLKEIEKRFEFLLEPHLDNDEKKELNHLFTFFFKIFCKKKISDFSTLKKKFPKIKAEEINTLMRNLNNEDNFFRLLSKIVSIFANPKDNQTNQDEKKQEEDLSQNKESKSENKEKLEKQEFLLEEIRGRQKIRSSDETESETRKEKVNCNFFKKPQYQIFTKKFDLSIDAKKIVPAQELSLLRKKLDKEYVSDESFINKLAKKLEKHLFSIQKNYWKFDQDEGYFDNSKFASFIANKNETSIFKIIDENFSKNTIVSLLLDNSGSMRGKPIVTAVKTTEIIAKILEKCKVNVEILGFTTREWKGGQSKKLWEETGKIEKPGRLNDLLHIVYKDSKVSWPVCKNNLALVLKEGILKENIDGEALLWASRRLRIKPERKKILIVISDGAPVDDSTLSANNSNILDDHLKNVIEKLENDSSIQLFAIGIGHDVSKYYREAFTIDDVSMLAEVLVENLVKLFKSETY